MEVLVADDIGHELSPLQSLHVAVGKARAGLRYLLIGKIIRRKRG